VMPFISPAAGEITTPPFYRVHRAAPTLRKNCIWRSDPLQYGPCRQRLV
jgi:hypothetical protein